MNVNFMIVGVGGQGTLLASRVLGDVFAAQGLEIKLSEVHGMSQRGGSVVTYVKAGEKVYSPVVSKGEADFIISFEKMEGARYIDCLKKGGVLVTNTAEIDPMPVITGAAQYPHDILDTMAGKGVQVDALDALKIAKEVGSEKAVNIVLLGRLSKYFDFTEEAWLSAIQKFVKPQFLEMNQKAFISGRNA